MIRQSGGDLFIYSMAAAMNWQMQGTQVMHTSNVQALWGTER